MGSVQDVGLRTALDTRLYLAGLLAETRAGAGLSQRAVAVRLGRSPSHVHMIETGRRRLDALELFRFALACGVDPIVFFVRVGERIEATEKGRAGSPEGTPAPHA